MILEMRDICKDYPMGKSVAHILKNVNLDVEEGEYLPIMMVPPAAARPR